MTNKSLPRCGAIAALAMCAPHVMALDLNLDPFMSSTRAGQPKSDVGLNMTADTLDLRGSIVTKRVGNATLVTPQLTSGLALDGNWKLQTQTTFANWNEQLDAVASSAFETRLTGRSVLPLVSEIEGAIARDSIGTERKKLRLTLKETTVAIAYAPIRLRTHASVESIAVPDGAADLLLTRVEATLAQQTSSTASNRIGLKYANQSGETEFERESAVFSRSWQQTKLLRLGVEWELMNEAASWGTTNLQNAVRFTWRGSF